MKVKETKRVKRNASTPFKQVEREGRIVLAKKRGGGETTNKHMF